MERFAKRRPKDKDGKFKKSRPAKGQFFFKRKA